MKTYKTALFLLALGVGLILAFSGCYTRVATEESNDETSYQGQDTTYQTQSRDYDDSWRYRSHAYVGFSYYYPSPYAGYDPWYSDYYASPWYYSSWYYSPWYFGGAFISYPFLYYPYYQYPYYSVYGYYPYNHGYGYGGYVAANGNYWVTRNSGYRRTGPSRGDNGSYGRSSTSSGTGYVSPLGSGYALPNRSGTRTNTGTNSTAVGTDRTGRTGSVNTGGSTVPTRGNSGQVVPNRVTVPSGRQVQGNQRQGTSTGGNRSGGYTRGSGESRHEGSSRPAYVPSNTPSRGSAPHYSPPPSNSGGRSSGGESRSSGGSRGKGR